MIMMEYMHAICLLLFIYVCAKCSSLYLADQISKYFILLFSLTFDGFDEHELNFAFGEIKARLVMLIILTHGYESGAKG